MNIIILCCLEISGSNPQIFTAKRRKSLFLSGLDVNLIFITNCDVSVCMYTDTMLQRCYENVVTFNNTE